MQELTQLAQIEDALEQADHNHDCRAIQRLLDDPAYTQTIKLRFPFFSEAEILKLCNNLEGENTHWRFLHPKGSIILRCRTKKAPFFVPGVHVTMAWRGSFQYSIQDTEFVLRQGDTCICNTNVPYTFSPNEPDSIALDFVMSDEYLKDILLVRLPGTSLSNDFFARSLYKSSSTRDYLYVQTSSSKLAGDLLANAVHEFTQKSYFADEVVNSYILLFFVEIARTYAKSYTVTSVSGNEYNISEILSYIEDHLDTATLNTVADHFHFSTSYLSVLLKRASGHSFKFHLQKARLNKACILLKHTDIAVSDIIDSVGYKNIHHFYTLFKETYHCTPGEYRARGAF